ncbi:hypothetical protein CCR95_16630 [Thiocystis minor]|nr:hypothetical protein [Thiocystis minor]
MDFLVQEDSPSINDFMRTIRQDQDAKFQSERAHAESMAQPAVTALLALLLLVAPLFRSGQPPLALLFLELLALVTLAVVLWNRPRGVLTAREFLALGLLLIIPLLYLIPLPVSVGNVLPGRETYLVSLSLLGLDRFPVSLNLSIVPLETQSAFLALLLPVAVFVGTRALDSKRIVTLVLLLIGIVAAEAILGLMQFGGGKESGLYLGMESASFGSAVGTYTNRNHLAGLIEMVLPVTLALFLYSMGRHDHERIRDWRRRVSFFGSMRGHAAFVYAVLAMLLLVGMIFTRSRAGIALTMLGVLLATLVFSRRIGGDNVYGPAGTVIAFALGFGIVIGLAPVFDRFAEMDPMEDLRWTMFSATIDGIGAFFPLGSGPGTYAAVFPAFQPVDLGQWFVNYAHNDYLQWLFEGGLAAALLIAWLLGLYFFQWVKVWTRDVWSRFRFVQVGAGIGLFLMLLHSLVDYNLHMPANMVYFAFLAGIFFSDSHAEAAIARRRRRKRHTPDLVVGSPQTNAGSVQPSGPHPEQIPNPLLD